MSWFTSYFSIPPPHDAKQSLKSAVKPHEKRLLEEPTEPVLTTPIQTTQPNRNRNKVIFGAGLSFFAFSLLITRRSFARKRLASQAQFYTNAPGHQAEQSQNVNGAMEAVEALNIATINVISVAMMAAGGALWYMDINSVDEARQLLRGGLGVDGSGRSEKEAEEDFEEWMASTLSRKEFKEQMKKEPSIRQQERR